MSSPLPSEEQKEIGSLNTAFDIIEHIGNGDYVGLTHLAEELDYSKSTIHYYLKTLEANRYVMNDADGYRLGLRCLKLGEQALQQHGFPSVISEQVDRLASETGLTALVAVEEGGKSVYVYGSQPDDEGAVRPYLGTEHPLHTTAFGKVILAYLPDEYVSEIITHHGLPRRTDETIVEESALHEELRTTREEEVAFDDGERSEGVRSVAAPVFYDEDELYGSIGIVGSADLLNDPHTHAKAQRFAETPSNIVKRFAHILRNKLGDLE